MVKEKVIIGLIFVLSIAAIILGIYNFLEMQNISGAVMGVNGMTIADEHGPIEYSPAHSSSNALSMLTGKVIMTGLVSEDDFSSFGGEEVFTGHALCAGKNFTSCLTTTGWEGRCLGGQCLCVNNSIGNNGIYTTGNIEAKYKCTAYNISDHCGNATPIGCFTQTHWKTIWKITGPKRVRQHYDVQFQCLSVLDCAEVRPYVSTCDPLTNPDCYDVNSLGCEGADDQAPCFTKENIQGMCMGGTCRCVYTYHTREKSYGTLTPIFAGGKKGSLWWTKQVSQLWSGGAAFKTTDQCEKCLPDRCSNSNEYNTCYGCRIRKDDLKLKTYISEKCYGVYANCSASYYSPNINLSAFGIKTGPCNNDGNCSRALGESTEWCDDCGGYCGDYTCDEEEEENATNCPADCTDSSENLEDLGLGDNSTGGGFYSAGTCNNNSVCERNLKEDTTSCDAECFGICGDGECDSDEGETASVCASDCGNGTLGGAGTGEGEGTGGDACADLIEGDACTTDTITDGVCDANLICVDAGGAGGNNEETGTPSTEGAVEDTGLTDAEAQEFTAEEENMSEEDLTGTETGAGTGFLGLSGMTWLYILGGTAGLAVIIVVIILLIKGKSAASVAGGAIGAAAYPGSGYPPYGGQGQQYTQQSQQPLNPYQQQVQQQYNPYGQYQQPQ
jgi:hypothetical protein